MESETQNATSQPRTIDLEVLTIHSNMKRLTDAHNSLALTSRQKLPSFYVYCDSEDMRANALLSIYLKLSTVSVLFKLLAELNPDNSYIQDVTNRFTEEFSKMCSLAPRSRYLFFRESPESYVDYMLTHEYIKNCIDILSRNEPLLCNNKELKFGHAFRTTKACEDYFTIMKKSGH